jgi:SAM-dependent methyltransferase
MNNKHFFSLLLVCALPLWCADQLIDRRKNIGVFKSSDPVISGLRWGNWGSRPYEYYWAASIIPLEGKRVIDLGVGLPSQYNWYDYAINTLKPAFYVGVDCDDRIKGEVRSGSAFEIKHMNMALLRYPDKAFDVALCISTFEHIPYPDFMKSIEEAHRVLKDDGLLIITLDEEWDKNQFFNQHNGWNELERSLFQEGLFRRTSRSFGLPEFLSLIQDYFVLAQDDAIIDAAGVIRSSRDGYVYYDRLDGDPSILNSGLPVNSCVSYAVLRKK